jgi:hypothetical protein
VAGFEAQVASVIAAIRKPDQIGLETGIHDLFSSEPDREWRDRIEAVARELTVDPAPPLAPRFARLNQSHRSGTPGGSFRFGTPVCDQMTSPLKCVP